MYSTEVAEFWDSFYQGRGRDYAGEAAEVAQLIRRRNPHATSLLDVACGTGEHLRHFGEIFDHVEGVELADGMLEVGRSRSPGLALHQGDMRTFDLGHRFGAITCLFSSIGEVKTTDELDTTLARFAAHLNPSGVVVLEPWWFPETYLEGYVAGDMIDSDGRMLGRISHSSREGSASKIIAHYMVADAESGLRHFTEELRITLFTQQEYEAAFVRAGGAVEYIDGGLSGRGMFVGVFE